MYLTNHCCWVGECYVSGYTVVQELCDCSAWKSMWLVCLIFSLSAADMASAQTTTERSVLLTTFYALLRKQTLVKFNSYALSRNFEKWLLVLSCLSVGLSVRLSVRPHRTTRLSMDEFSLNFIRKCDLGVACWPLIPKFAGSNPAEAVGLLIAKKILSTPSFGGEVKPSFLCHRFAACM